jgi:hypothetical protein
MKLLDGKKLFWMTVLWIVFYNLILCSLIFRRSLDYGIDTSMDAIFVVLCVWFLAAEKKP